jgi:circadian clock protein KaiC
MAAQTGMGGAEGSGVAGRPAGSNRSVGPLAERSGDPARHAPVSTGVAGLDRILRGGIPAGSVVLLAGSPGTGKTTLGSQFAFRYAASGGSAVFATVMAESHDRMLMNLSGFEFFDRSLAGTRIQYLSLLPALEEGGLDGLLAATRGFMREHDATLLVIDGTTVIEDFAESPIDYRRFVHRLQVQSMLLGWTTLLLTNRRSELIDEIATHVDGLIHMQREPVGARVVRTIEVAKLRGTNHLTGRHEFMITPAGIDVCPRLEAALADAPPPVEATGERLAFGVPSLDHMLGGGLLPGSSTLLLGTPGAGKTIMGLHFVMAGAERGERTLIAGLQESPERLVATAAGIGLDLGRHVDAGTVRILWRQPLELSPDAWAWQLINAVEEHRPARLFVDTLTDVQRRMFMPERLTDFMTALANELRTAGVTTLFAAELDTVVGPELSVPFPAVSALLDNAIVLRHFELESRLQRLISVLKVRQSGFDPTIRAFVIEDQGINVGDVFIGAAALLTGVPVPTHSDIWTPGAS